ncbi:alpha/beta fold hydrolase [Streptomyces sp. NPDC048604]|uniref:alpha/beta fold hydrolase n=1 Tax=Streptomyces sp. NPDC048604 TaxID=3365578 RepID=UPI003720895E
MTAFVLVPGAWLGAWAWDEVAAELRAAGHEAHPLTLTGLAEKRDLPAGQRTHVDDIVAEVDRLGSDDVVLVGHSYSGIPVGQAAQRIGNRLRRVVFVDAGVPAHGESFASAWWQGQPAFEAELAAHGGDWAPITAPECAGQDLTDDRIAHFLAGATPHPGASLTEPAVVTGSLADLPATYVKCLLDGEEPTPDVAALLKSDSWRLVEMETGHWPMFSRPRELAAVLMEQVSGRTP